MDFGGVNFSPALSAWQWSLLALVPPAIVLLYFLKLRRQPLEVPSTYLWSKTIEDLHVNSLWQRLRQSLLLLLQLLIILLAALALLRPNWRGAQLHGDRFIFMIDNSASMSATDVAPSRLEVAKKRVGELIDEMPDGAVAMILSFSNAARVEQLFTDNRRELRRRLQGVSPTNRPTALGEALRAAAGLANPGRAAFDISDTQVAEEQPATVYLLSDGRFAPVANFSLGNLTPIYLPIGTPDAANLGITSFSAQRDETRSEQLQAFARLENRGPNEATSDVELYLDDVLLDARKVTVKAGENESLLFPLDEVRRGVLNVRLSQGGLLKEDDQAWTTINPPRRCKVLLVTAGDELLELSLGTDRAKQLADISTLPPDKLNDVAYKNNATSGRYDLIIYDRASPENPPQANTLYIGALPPGGQWKSGPKVGFPQVIDVDAAHPLTQLVELTDVTFFAATPITGPIGSNALIETQVGPLLAIAPRDEFQDAVLGTEIIGVDSEGGRIIGSDWPKRLSFPVFMLNVLEFLGGTREASQFGSLRPGQLAALRPTSDAKQIKVRDPSGQTLTLDKGKLSAFNYAATEKLGVYDVEEDNAVTQRFAVNLFDSNESDIGAKPEQGVQIGYTKVEGQATIEGARHEGRQWLLLLALAAIAFEWYVYNRRVYI